jgi:hypothetical protein
MSDIYNLLQGDNDVYSEKMIHPIPDTKVLDRVKFILDRCKGKKVIDIGGSGPMSKLLKEVAYTTTVDRKDADICLDVEKDELPKGEYDIILCGEILEHLSNAGIFLDKLHKYNLPIIITVPNAFGNNRARVGIENVNKEHVAWYSYYTLKVLIERHGFTLYEWYWYNGKPYTAEGIIFVIGRI